VASEITTTSHNDLHFAAWVRDRILDENRPYNVMEPLFDYEGKRPTNAFDFPIQDDPGAASGYTEGTGLSNTAMTTSKATATAGTFGMMATVTQEHKETSVIDSVEQVAAVLGRSVAEKFETDATALLDDFANTSGTSGQPTTYATLLAGKNKLAQRDQEGTPVFVLDPAQVGSVNQDVATSGASIYGHPATDVNGMTDTELSGFTGMRVGGTPVLQTSLVTSSGGAVFLAGLALAHYEIRPQTTETFRDVTLPGDQIVTTRRYGLVEQRDVAGETIVSS
jgi:predicted SpoU family rRNA methylase